MTNSLIDPTPRVLAPELPPVGPLAFGLWRFTDADTARSQAVLEAALDLGMNLVDNADVYGFDWGGSGFGGNEEILGNVLTAAPALRDRMVLASKGGILPGVPYDQSPGALREACEASLRRMRVEVIDLYQIHRPDLFAHPHDVAATLTALRDEGKIRAVGVSNFTPDQYDALAAHLDFPIATTQPEYSALHLQPLRDGTFDRCLRDGVTPLAWSPLAGGRLVGDGDRVLPPDLAKTLDRLAEREGVGRATLAYAFVLAHPSRPVCILGTQRIERLSEATQALGVTLTRSDAYDVIEAAEGAPLP
jgi:predicted oxidoreductase